MQQFKAILFDLDGTLVDTGALIIESAEHTVEETFGEIAHSSVIIEAIGKPLKQQMDFLSTTYFGTHRPLGGVKAESPEELSTQMMNVYSAYCKLRHGALIQSFKEIPAVLDKLQEKSVPVAVVTSKRREPAINDLKHFGLDAYFRTVVAADDIEKHKPEPEPLWRGMELLSAERGIVLTPEKCIYVGDSPYDMQAAHAARMHAIAVTYGVFSREILEKENPKEVFDSPAALITLASRF